MLHFSCDFCGKHLDDRRFVANLSMYPVFDPEKITEEDLDIDNLQAVANDINAGLEENQIPPSIGEQSSSKDFRFDLCSGCYQKVLKDPLGHERTHRFNFSEN